MLFTKRPENVDDIRAFCARFREGIRVEYKSVFDDNVRRALPKVVSSFLLRTLWVGSSSLVF